MSKESDTTEATGQLTRTWPRGAPVDADASVRTTCDGCGVAWVVHENLAGYRFRCEHCQTWVNVPRPERATPLQIEMGRALARSEGGDAEARVDTWLLPIEKMPVDEEGLHRLEIAKGQVYEGDIPPSAAMAPGSVRNVRNDVRKRWTTRASMEIALMLLSILLPQVLLLEFASEDQRIVLSPLAAMIGGIGVILVGFAAPEYTFGALRRAPLWSWFAGIGGAAVAVGCAFGWTALAETLGEGPGLPDEVAGMREVLGPWGLVFVYAVSPALFEELAFRGLLQGRLLALMGWLPGILSTATLFAVAHGISMGTPLHLGIGLFLGWLRDRSGSLWPGILLHLGYNATLVLTAAP